ncbi:thioredoxin domain-containing protein [Reichenbachiella sp. MALMAid0571]|uniref:thioredoxin domain-containing protein n=1 Tax=Reichenbachiella sp. MALMAid0571 TaxID=3143939 RepID=UPI0032E0375C
MNSNSLINETSPYLLQHADNPVNWYAWNDRTLSKAKNEDKPILVSIGYSTCHWCHVMERESFENEEIAKVMNEYFVCIKVDREERPDVDQVYMDALHAMGLQGGWPLNVFLMPDQKPFYGGTYFPAQGWKSLLLNIAEVFKTKRDALEESAVKFVEALNRDQFSGHQNNALTEESLDKINANLINGFDRVRGGMGSAPKFPMPVIWKYMIQYLANDEHNELSNQLHLTLEKIALGGIYDQVGGGFARYSTDADWFAPHFEKMLYDNGQLLSVYSDAYKLKPNTLYKHAVYQTVEWLNREMLDESGAFYSALDADSEGIEGKFYVWTDQELKECLKEDFLFAQKYYNASRTGNWEHGWNILHRRVDDVNFAKEKSLKPEELNVLIQSMNDRLLEKRLERIRPGLDDKILTGWNALMSKGLLDAYKAFGDRDFLDLAINNVNYILSTQVNGNLLYHSAGRQIKGFMDDYGLVIELLIETYQITFDETYIEKARELTEYCLDEFYDLNQKFFYYTSRSSERLIADKKEIHDNVIPASNSVMAGNLLKLGTIFENEKYTDAASYMIAKLSSLTEREPRFMTNWAVALHLKLKELYEVVIVGEKANDIRNELSKHSLPNHIFMGTESNSDLPLLKDRTAVNGQTTIYVCRNRTCQLPVHTVEEALARMKL